MSTEFFFGFCAGAGFYGVMTIVFAYRARMKQLDTERVLAVMLQDAAIAAVKK